MFRMLDGKLFCFHLMGMLSVPLIYLQSPNFHKINIPKVLRKPGKPIFIQWRTHNSLVQGCLRKEWQISAWLDLVRFPKWYECHFQSGLGNLTRLELVSFKWDGEPVSRGLAALSPFQQPSGIGWTWLHGNYLQTKGNHLQSFARSDYKEKSTRLTSPLPAPCILLGHLYVFSFPYRPLT